MRTWVKLYTRINHDPEFGSLTWAQRGIWMALLAVAGEIDDRDGSDQPTGKVDTVVNTAWRLRCDKQELDDALAAFVERGWVRVEDGVIWVTNFARLQPVAPSEGNEAVAERVRRLRARQKSREASAEAPNVTALQGRYAKGVTPLSVVTCADGHTHTETPSDTANASTDTGYSQANTADSDTTGSTQKGAKTRQKLRKTTGVSSDTAKCNGVTGSLRQRCNDGVTIQEKNRIDIDSLYTRCAPENCASRAGLPAGVRTNDNIEDDDHGNGQAPSAAEKNAVRSALRQHFTTRTGISPPSARTPNQLKAVGRLWWNPLREIAELANWNTEAGKRLIDRALDRLQGLTVADPNSIIRTARAVAADNGPNGMADQVERFLADKREADWRFGLGNTNHTPGP